VTRLLDQVGQFRGYPKAIRTDQGPEFTSLAGDNYLERSATTIVSG